MIIIIVVVVVVYKLVNKILNPSRVTLFLQDVNGNLGVVKLPPSISQVPVQLLTKFKRLYPYFRGCPT